MSWGNSGWGTGWGNSGWGRSGSSGSSGGWGRSGFGGHDSRDPEGQHISSCIAENTWGRQGPFSDYYDERCPGCRRDRAMRPWGSSKGGLGSTAIKIGALYVAKKSLFD